MRVDREPTADHNINSGVCGELGVSGFLYPLTDCHIFE